MKKDILAILRCACGGGELNLEIHEEDHQEIRRGTVRCLRCAKIFSISAGILDMDGKIPGGEDETLGWTDFARKEGWLQPEPLYLSSLPFTCSKKFHPGDTLTWDRHGRNFFRTLSHLDLEGKQILDLGAGRCWTTKYLSMMNGRCVATDLVVDRYIGLQTSDFFFQESRVYFDRVRCDMRCLPFAERTFDIVFAQGAIHHSTDLKVSFQEASRVLKRGGMLVLTNESCSGLNGCEKLEIEDMPGIHEHNYRGYRQLKWLVESGFGDFKIIPDVYYWRKTDPYYTWLSEWGKIHPLFIQMKLLLHGGVFNLITVKK